MKEINLNERKENDSNINIPKLEDNKIVQVQVELVDSVKNDDCNSIKSYRSNSTTQSKSKSKRKMTNASTDNNQSTKTKTIKLDNEDSNDNITNEHPELTINLEDAKLSCHGGIVTPSTSSCASSTSSNFSKSPDSIDSRPKCKDTQIDLKLTNNANCIDAFGNFLNKQMNTKCDTISREEEEETLNKICSLEELLKKQWDLGSSLCQNLSKKFDCMDLLDLLYKCKQENIEMEKRLKYLEQTNLDYDQMNKKLSLSFNNKIDEPIPMPIKKYIQPLNEQTASSLSFNKVINDQIQNQVSTNKSSFQPSTNSMNYSNLIQQSLSYLHSKSPHKSSSPTQNSTNSLLNLYNKQMQNQSPNQSSTLTNFQQPTIPWNPATCNSPTKSNISAQNNVNSSSLSSLLSQNQLLQSFQQLNPIQQQQIASYYYMAAASNSSAQSIAPSNLNNFNT